MRIVQSRCIILYIRNAYARARARCYTVSLSLSLSLLSLLPFFPLVIPLVHRSRAFSAAFRSGEGGAEIGEEVEERERKTSERERARARVGKQRERAEERCVSA